LLAAGSKVVLVSVDISGEIKGRLLIYFSYIIVDSALTDQFLIDI